MKRAEVGKIIEFPLNRIKFSVDGAVDCLKPLITQKLPFPLFDYAGEIIGERMKEEPERLFVFLDKIEATKAMGGYVVIGASLAQLIGIWKSLPQKKLWERLPSLDRRVLNK